MLFNSLEFILVFLPVTYVGYLLIAGYGRRDLAVTWLVAASLFFYGWWDWRLVGLLAGSVVANYLIGRALQKRAHKALLVAGIAFNLGLLGWFKYAGFLTRAVNAVAGTSFDLGNIVLPLAISFFTFQQIAYLVDVYRGFAREHGLLHYGLFVTFFPQLIAGPIVHHAEMMPQFDRPGAFKFSAANFAIGATIFAIGLLKKVGLADPMGAIADGIFDAAARGQAPTIIPAWTGTVAFSLQIYFDFSGYSDMAIGLARLFGIKLPLNFDSPYRAVNIVEFWRRWHMTLSRFLRDYLYFPLGGNRHGQPRRYVNLMVVMLLGGLWHGAAWTFVVWGGLHGLYLAINHGWHALRRRLGQDPETGTVAGRAAARVVTLLAVTVAWVFFRSETWDAVGTMLSGMSGLNGMFLPESYADRLAALAPILSAWGWQFGAGSDVNLYPALNQLFEIAAIAAIALFLPNTQQWLAQVEPALNAPAPRTGIWQVGTWFRANALTGATAAVAVFAGIVLLLKNQSDAFVYFQF